MGCFVQSYENNRLLDSSILIAPLVFFIAPNDPRFIGTLERILQPPEKGGLTSTGLVYRYDTALSEDGVGGREGACTYFQRRSSLFTPPPQWGHGKVPLLFPGTGAAPFPFPSPHFPPPHQPC